MSHKYEDLRSATDADLIAAHDERAEHTGVGVNYYLEELHRRDLMRATKASQRLAAGSLVLSVVATVAAILALFLA